MALTAGGTERKPVVDNWDDSKHTPVENAIVHLLKYLMSRDIVSYEEQQEIAASFPILWGNER
jgi:hypothetical protein